MSFLYALRLNIFQIYPLPHEKQLRIINYQLSITAVCLSPAGCGKAIMNYELSIMNYQ